MNFISAKDSPPSIQPVIESITNWLRWVPRDESSLKVLVVVALALSLTSVAALAWWSRNKPRRKKSGPFLRTRPTTAGGRYIDMANPSNQLEAIAKVGFERVRLLNREEVKLLPLLEKASRDVGQGHRVMAQTSLGEVIRPVRNSAHRDLLGRAFASINSKRLDFAIFDRSGLLVCAVEYHGTGHHKGTAFMRDAVKKEALRRAGVTFVEVYNNFDPAEVSGIVMRALGAAPPGSDHRHSAVHM